MKKFAFLFLLAIITVGCGTEIQYPDDPPEYSDVNPSEDTPKTIEHPVFTENRVQDYGIILRLFEEEFSCSENFPELISDDLHLKTPTEYIKVSTDESITFEIEPQTSQHYKVEVIMYGNGGAVGLYTGDIEHGAYYTSVSNEFETFSLQSIYLREGRNTVEFKPLRGTAYISSVKISQMDIRGIRNYDTSTDIADINASLKTRNLLEYLRDIYGHKTLTAQHTTINSNAEINAIYEATGRYPAIRAGDMMNYSRCYGGTDKNDNKELELSEEWARFGGLVALSWTWYSPMPSGGSHYYAANTTFEIDKAVGKDDLALADLDQLNAMNEADIISDETLELIIDIDEMAENLKYLTDKEIPVLWRPMKEPALRWYWWGNGKPESYIYVWRLMFNRFHKFHELDNLIWIWTGESDKYYPGDEYVDIIGADVYNMTDTSNVTRFDTASSFSQSGKMIGLTECGLAPNPDILWRDNALWLYFALYKGDYLIGSDGLHASAFNLKDNLKYIYSHELTVTLDELIPF